VRHAQLRRREKLLAPSGLVRKFASKICGAAGGAPILDVACGTGRNAIFLSQLGCDVVCADKNLDRFEGHQSRRLSTVKLDFLTDPWPFGHRTLGGIVDVHFLLSRLFPLFEKSLIPGGYLLLETVAGHGGNYLELPEAGMIKKSLQTAFQLEFYKECHDGPENCNAVSVQTLARRVS
jgi:SAM-dependent methyltransferase